MNVTKALTKDYENIRPRRRAEMLTVQVNLPLNPADKTNWSHPQAQNAQTFYLKNVETKDPDRPGT